MGLMRGNSIVPLISSVQSFSKLGFKRLGGLAFAYTVVIVKNLLEVAQGDAVVGEHRIDSQRHLLSNDNIASGL